MTTQTSGPISIGNVSVEVAVPSTTQNSLNSTLPRTLAGKPTGTISLKDMYGKSLNVSPISGGFLDVTVLLVGGGGGGGAGYGGDFRLPSGGGGAGVFLLVLQDFHLVQA